MPRADAPRARREAYHFRLEWRLVDLVEQLVKVDSSKERMPDDLFAVVLAAAEALRVVATEQLYAPEGQNVHTHGRRVSDPGHVAFRCGGPSPPSALIPTYRLQQ